MKKSAWKFGICSNDSPTETMNSLFDALIKLNMKWKVSESSPYCIKIRHETKNGDVSFQFFF